MNARIFTFQTMNHRLLSVLALLGLLLTPLASTAPGDGSIAEVIVQAEDTASAAALVQDVGGTVRRYPVDSERDE